MYLYDDKQCYDAIENISHNIAFYKSELVKIIKDNLSNTNIDTPYYKVLHYLSKDEQITPFIDIAKSIRENFDNIIMIGMGGSTSNANALINLIGIKANSPKVYFLNTTDPFNFNNVISNLDLKKTISIVISSSGDTLETIYLANAMINHYINHNIQNYRKNFIFIAGQSNNKLTKIAKEHNIITYPHVKNINGRYSTFSNITTLLCLILEMDLDSLFRGALDVINNFWKNKENSIPSQAALMLIASKKSIVTNIAYLESFDAFLFWYAQIISESIAKDNKGITPVSGIGPNEQHGRFQLYLDGPCDKLFTMINVNLSNIKNQNENLSKININCFNASIQALQQKKLPVRQIILNDLSEYTIGGLMMHCIIETILSALLINVNPFDQPSVKLIKDYIQKYDNNLL